MNGVLFVVPHGFEEIETVTPIDLLRRANVTVTIAALAYPIQLTGRSRIELLADGPLDEYLNNRYEAIVLVGGPGATHYRGHPTLIPMLKAHKGITAAICSAPVILAEAGLLAGKRYTCHPSKRNELTAAVNEPVVVDGKIVTAAGAGCSFAFGLKLVELLAGADKAAEIAKATEYAG